MESKWKTPGCLWSSYCRADRHRQNEIGWEGQSIVQKGESVDLLCQYDFLMSMHLEICFRCVTSSQQWLRTSRGQWSWRSWGRETSLRLSSRWVVNKNIVHTILKHISTILLFEKSTTNHYRKHKMITPRIFFSQVFKSLRCQNKEKFFDVKISCF